MTAMRLASSDGEGRRIRYTGVFGCKCSLREGNDESKDDDVKGIEGSAISDSCEIVMGSANSEALEVNELKASCSSLDAIQLS